MKRVLSIPAALLVAASLFSGCATTSQKIQDDTSVGANNSMTSVVSGISGGKSYGTVMFRSPSGNHSTASIGGGGKGIFMKMATRIPYVQYGHLGGIGSDICVPFIGYVEPGVTETLQLSRQGSHIVAKVVYVEKNLKGFFNKRLKNGCTKNFVKVPILSTKKISTQFNARIGKRVVSWPYLNLDAKKADFVVTLYLTKDFPVNSLPKYPAFTKLPDTIVTPGVGMGMGGGMIGGIAETPGISGSDNKTTPKGVFP